MGSHRAAAQEYPVPHPASAAVSDSIRTVLDSSAAGWNRGDLAGYLSLCTDDVTSNGLNGFVTLWAGPSLGTQALGLTAPMAGDAVREFIDQIDAISPESREVDVLIHSTGGDGLTAWKLMSELRERFDRVAVFVPFMAFSAATIFALGADEIVMHPHASLGPIDPQITIQLPDGSKPVFAFEDLGAFLRFLNTEVGLSEQGPLSTIVDRLFSAVDPVHVGGAKRASELATDVGERLLQMHMRGDGERERARDIAERLNKNFFAHGDAVSRSRARDLQLKIAENNPELESLIWNAYLALESYMQLRLPFKPAKYFLDNGGAAAVGP